MNSADTTHHGTTPAGWPALPAGRPPGPSPAAPPDSRPERGRWQRLRRTARHHALRVFALYGTLKLIGFAVFLHLLQSSGDYRGKHPRFGGGAHAWDVLVTWDGWWYQQIAAHGYHPALVPVPGATGLITLEGNSAAFFPLYPALMRLVSECTGLGLFGAGLLVSVVASFVAALGIYTVTARLGGRQAALAAAGLWAVWPGSGVEWSGYSESVYVALAVWACHAVMTRRWPTAGILACAAGLARPTAAALIAAVGLAALLSILRHRGGAGHRGDLLRPAAAAVTAPLGLLGYLLWVGHRMGDWGGYFKLQKGAWAHTFDYGTYTLTVFRSVPVGHFNYLAAFPFADIVAVATVLLALILTPLLIRLRPPAVLTVHTILTIVLVLSSQQIFANVSRYLLPAFPLFIPVAVAMRRLGPVLRFTLLAVAAVASGSYAGYVLFELGVP
ncbi:hypothetical protein [Streptomyces sp. NPDC046197]|uniref:hypothetical protein n=1 Tax=Streptomyces sp. NPDC046197 TaxID=3154337 RepID=UPI0033D3EF36